MLSHNTTARKGLARVGTLVVGLLASFGCASQNWVIDTIREVDKDLVARVAQIETTAAAEKARVDQQLTEIRGIATDARARADAAASAAQSAGQRADAAMARANEGVNKADAVDGRLTRVLANRLKRTPVLQVDMFFNSGKSDLSAEAQTALQGVVKLMADNPTYTADIVGFTDKVGAERYNVNLSWRREEAIRRFLMEKGAQLNRYFFIGMGEDLAAGKTAAGEAKDRRGAVQVYSPAD